MAAGLGFKDFVTGEVLTAADVDGYLMQGVWVFADAAARTAAVTSPQEGNISFLKDTNSTEYYSGSAWVSVGESVPTSLGFTAGKNKIINGDFSINQRSFTSTSSNAIWGFDRWQLSAGTGTFTYSAQTFTPGAAPVAGYEAANFARLVTSGQTATSGFAALVNNIEDVRTFAGQTVTFSFWAKAASGTPQVQPTLVQEFGSGGSAVVPTAGTAVTISTSWARYSATISVPSISGKTIGTSSMVRAQLWTSLGTDFPTYGNIGVQAATIDFWGVQVENGSTATAFQTATGTIQGELEACQRYYFRYTAAQQNTNFASGLTVSTTSGVFIVNFPTTMRTAPTSIEFSSLQISDNNSYGSSITTLTLTADAGGTNTQIVNAGGASGLTSQRPAFIRGSTAGVSYIGMNSEL